MATAKATGRKALVVRFVRGREQNVEGTAASYLRSDKVGRHHAYEFTETDRGVEYRKNGVTGFAPWAGILTVEYGDV